MDLFRARLAEKFVWFGIARTNPFICTGKLASTDYRHAAGSGQLAQNSWCIRFVVLSLAHTEIPIARALAQLHPILFGNLKNPMITIAWFLHSLIHNWSRPIPVLPWPKPKVPAIIEASSKILKRCIVTYRMKRGDTNIYLGNSIQFKLARLCKWYNLGMRMYSKIADLIEYPKF